MMNPAIAKVIRDMAVRDGTLSTAMTASRSGPDGPEMTKYPSRQEAVHPEAGSSPRQSMGQHAVVTDRRGGGPRTGPTEDEAYARSRGSLTHTADEKGINPDAIVDMLMAMGIPPYQINAILMEMSGGT